MPPRERSDSGRTLLLWEFYAATLLVELRCNKGKILIPLFVLTQKVELKSQGKSNCSAAFAIPPAQVIELLVRSFYDG